MRDGRGSRTAERVAVRRAAHQILDRPLVLDDPLAVSILPADERAELLANPQKLNENAVWRALRAFLVVRSRFAEDALAAAIAHGASQYVILGAGLDTSAYRPPCSTTQTLRVFEVDHPDTQAVKRERLAAANIAVPPNVTFVGADLARVSLRDALQSGRFDFDSAAFTSWLGVVPYLTLDAITATLELLGSLRSSSEIVFDYGLPPSELNVVARMVHSQLAQRVEAAGEPWKTYFKPSEARELLERCGFTVIDDLGREELTGRYLVNNPGMRLGSAGRIVHAKA